MQRLANRVNDRACQNQHRELIHNVTDYFFEVDWSEWARDSPGLLRLALRGSGRDGAKEKLPYEAIDGIVKGEERP